MTLDLDLLRCFAHLHRERHLTRAAQRARLSQPAMSRVLARMREVFDDPLFVRTPRGMLPTPRAELLAPEIDAVLAAAGALVRPPSFEPASLARTFVIATADMFELDIIPRLVELLAKRAPNVAIQTRPVGDHVDEPLATGHIDLLISVRASIPPDAMAAQLFEDGFVCAVRGDHPRVGKRLTLDTFVELPHLQIAPRGEPGGAVDSALDALGLARRVVVRTAGFLSAPAIVASSDLILTAPARMLRPLAAPFQLRLLEPPVAVPRFTAWQAWHARQQHDAAHAWFRAQVAAVARATRVSARRS